LEHPPPAPNLVKVAQGDLSLMGKFLPKIRNIRDMSYVSPNFCAHNVEILLKRTDL